MPRAFNLTNKPGLLEFQKLLYFFIWILLGYLSLLAFFHSEQLVWSGYIYDSNYMSFFLFLVMSSDVQRIILLPCMSLFLCQLIDFISQSRTESQKKTSNSRKVQIRAPKLDRKNS